MNRGIIGSQSMGATSAGDPVKNKNGQTNYRSVSCPDCGALIDTPCLNADGGETHSLHQSRRRIAVRLRDTGTCCSLHTGGRPCVHQRGDES